MDANGPRLNAALWCGGFERFAVNVESSAPGSVSSGETTITVNNYNGLDRVIALRDERFPMGGRSSATEIARSLRMLFALASALVFVPLAAAHAFLDHAIPGVASTVHEPPAQLKLWFSERLEREFSTVEVLDRSDQRIDKGDPQVDSADPTLLRISLPRLAPGRYRVTWRVLSVDTHVAKGQFTFDVAP
jgi:copper resistance protein C